MRSIYIVFVSPHNNTVKKEERRDVESRREEICPCVNGNSTMNNSLEIIFKKSERCREELRSLWAEWGLKRFQTDNNLHFLSGHVTYHLHTKCGKTADSLWLLIFLFYWSLKLINQTTAQLWLYLFCVFFPGTTIMLCPFSITVYNACGLFSFLRVRRCL